MKKTAFYSKLALGNLWRNKSTYLPYLLACVISIFTFYTLLAINMNGALDGMRNEAIVKSFTAIGTVIVAIFCSILIFYTNSFLIKRRKKEIGLYSILGMEKKNIGVLMFFETVFIAFIALVLGLCAGMLFSRLLFLLLLRMTRFPISVEMPIVPGALVFTAAFFGIVFLLALLSNLRQVHISNPINLMAGANQGEKEPKASWLLTIIGVACLAGGYFLALYFKSPLESLMYFLIAVALVIIGTFCLFTSGSIALLKMLRKNKKFYYKPGHFISVSGLIYRMKQNAAGLAAICILSCMVLVTVSATISLNVGAEDSLNVQYPYEYEMQFNAPEDGDTLLAGMQAIADDTGVGIAHLQDYRTRSLQAKREGDTFTSHGDYTGISSMAAIGFAPLEDYNRSESTNVTLAQGEALMFMTGGSYTKATLTLDGVTYKVHRLDTLGVEKSGTADFGQAIMMVVPDAAAVNKAIAASFAITGEAEDAAPWRRTLAFDLTGDEAAKEAFLTTYQGYIGEITTTDYFRFSTREGSREGWYATNGGFLFLGVYFGVLFLLAATLIIYYKQISEGYDDAARFEILQKVGMSEDEVKKTINGQILMVFFLPLIVAIIHVAVAFFPVSRAMIIFSVINIPLLVIATVGTILAYALVYMLVYRRTAKTYFRLVRRQSASN